MSSARRPERRPCDSGGSSPTRSHPHSIGAVNMSYGCVLSMRACALHALISLSANFRNARKMVEADIRNMLYQAAEDEQLETGDRRSCRFAAERLEGAEHYEFDEPEAQEHEVEGDAVVDGGDSTAAVEPIGSGTG